MDVARLASKKAVLIYIPSIASEEIQWTLDPVFLGHTLFFFFKQDLYLVKSLFFHYVLLITCASLILFFSFSFLYLP